MGSGGWLVTNFYPTRDPRWSHLHGGLDSDRSLWMLGLPTRRDIGDWMEVIEQSRDGAGATCLTLQGYQERAGQGRAIADDALYLLEELTSEKVPPVAWPAVETETFRPLEGINVVDLTRAIAGLCATVVRVSNVEFPDLGIVLFESNPGKRDAHLELKTERDWTALLRLIGEADVVLDG
ncbi:Uu.00g103650.m01.CDS01 [Anthostomella pinea]|uniref:Uu.00g103650.m01.CDS01 n=1 Tax=Anthostomella pinea TaxID=933095 RepID=A0AAI8VDJ6_9PEZI|nr:Uu.00g103650.m01.CDS01 [Anthostomella pinea]